jgi:hypothetical protein
LGEVLRVGISDDALCLIAKRKLGVTKEGVVGSGNKPPRHLQDGISGSGLDASRQFLGFGFLFGGQWLGHRDLQSE